MAGCAEGIRPAQDAVQSFCALEPQGRIQQDFCRSCRTTGQAGAIDDRRHASQGAPHGSQPAKKGALSRCIGRTKGGLNSKLHAVCDERGRPIAMALTEGQASDYKGAALLLPVLPKAKTILADRGYDADWFRAALMEKGITPCIPPRKNRKTPITYDKELYKQRHKVENMFGRLKDWRRIAMRYDRCAHTFFSAICIAAFVTFYLNQ